MEVITIILNSLALHLKLFLHINKYINFSSSIPIFTYWNHTQSIKLIHVCLCDIHICMALLSFNSHNIIIFSKLLLLMT